MTTPNKLLRAITPVPGCEPEIGRALWTVEETRRRTLRPLAGLTVEEIDAPSPVGANTIGTILYHIALIETSYVYDDILQTEYPDELKALLPLEDRDEAGILLAMKGQPLESYLARLAKVREHLMAAFLPMTLEEFHRIRDYEGMYDISPEWVLYHMTHHETEHAGQMQMIMESLRSLERE